MKIAGCAIRLIEFFDQVNLIIFVKVEYFPSKVSDYTYHLS